MLGLFVFFFLHQAPHLLIFTVALLLSMGGAVLRTVIVNVLWHVLRRAELMFKIRKFSLTGNSSSVMPGGSGVLLNSIALFTTERSSSFPSKTTKLVVSLLLKVMLC